MKGNTRKRPEKESRPPEDPKVNPPAPSPAPSSESGEVSAPSEAEVPPPPGEDGVEEPDVVELTEQEAILQSPVARVLAYRKNCSECGTPISPKWPQCPVCGGKYYVTAEQARYEGIDAALEKHRKDP